MKQKKLVSVFLVLGIGLVLMAFAKKEKENNLSFTIKKYEYDNGRGKSVEVSGLEDKEKEDTINQILLKDSKAVLAPYDLKDENVTVTMDINYKYNKNNKELIVRYEGLYINKTAAHPTSFYGISIVDVNNAVRKDVTKNMNYSKLTNAILKGKFKVIAENEELKNAQKDYLLQTSKEEYKTLFKSVNFKEKNGIVIKPEVFLIKNKDKITLILPTIHALGDYAEIEVLVKDIK